MAFSVDFKNGIGANYIDTGRANPIDLQRPEFITAWSSIQKLQIEFDLGDETASSINRLLYTDLPFHLQELTLKSVQSVSGESLRHFLCRYHRSLRKISLNSLFLDEGDCVPILRSLQYEFPALKEIAFLNLRDGREGLHFPAVSKNPIVDEAQGANFTFISTRRRGERRNIGISYSGPKIDIALLRLVDRAQFF